MEQIIQTLARELGRTAEHVSNVVALIDAGATIPFIAKAGADLVYLRCKQLLGEPIDTNVSFDYGLKMVKYYDAHYYR